MSLKAIAGLWLLGVGAIYGLMYGLGSVLLLRSHGWAALALGAVLLVVLTAVLRRRA